MCHQAKHAKDEHHAAEDARINAAVAEADRKAQEAAEKLAAKRRAMQQECDKVSQYQPSVWNQHCVQQSSAVLDMLSNAPFGHVHGVVFCTTPWVARHDCCCMKSRSNVYVLCGMHLIMREETKHYAGLSSEALRESTGIT